MDKFRWLIYAVIAFGAFKAIAFFRFGTAESLNQLIPMLLIAAVLTVIYWIVKALKTQREKTQETHDRAASIQMESRSTKPLGAIPNERGRLDKEKNESQNERNNVGWYIFSALLIGGLVGGGGGFMLAHFTLGMSEQASEVFGWACAIGLGIVSFKKRWECF